MGSLACGFTMCFITDGQLGMWVYNVFSYRWAAWPVGLQCLFLQVDSLACGWLSQRSAPNIFSVLQVGSLACGLLSQRSAPQLFSVLQVGIRSLACGLLSRRSPPHVFSVLQVALSEVRASCFLCITGGQLGLRVALSEVRASCILCITGGQLGLWVGISVITICELVDLVAQLLAYVFSQSEQPGNSKKTQQFSSNAYEADELPQKNNSKETDNYGTVLGSIY